MSSSRSSVDLVVVCGEVGGELHAGLGERPGELVGGDELGDEPVLDGFELRGQRCMGGQVGCDLLDPGAQRLELLGHGGVGLGREAQPVDLCANGGEALDEEVDAVVGGGEARGELLAYRGDCLRELVGADEVGCEPVLDRRELRGQRLELLGHGGVGLGCEAQPVDLCANGGEALDEEVDAVVGGGEARGELLA